jgi:putative transposase
LLKQIVREEMNAHPFEVDAMVVLPEHLHAIWTLPIDDADFSGRWQAYQGQAVRDAAAQRKAVGEYAIEGRAGYLAETVLGTPDSK